MRGESWLIGVVAVGLSCVLAGPALGEEPGLEGRDDIYMQTSFESDDWYAAWGESSAPQNTEVVETDDAFRGDRLLRVTFPEGEHYGTSFGYAFADREGSEPEEVYFRYVMRLGPNWRAHRNGKLPGFGGTYGEAGWGGRPSNGDDGWSARMRFSEPDSGAEEGRTQIGYYVYHPDMSGMYGDSWNFSGGPLGPGDTLARGEWYQVEGYVRMNDPNGGADTEGERNGVLRAWVNGTQVLDKTDLRFRDVADLKVEKVWFDLYYGGSWTAPADMTIEFDNVVIAENYVGPYSDSPPGGGDAGGDAGEVDTGDTGGPGPEPDTGGGPGEDASTGERLDTGSTGADVGGSDAASAQGGGCGCAAPGRSVGGGVVALAILFVLAAVRFGLGAIGSERAGTGG